MSRIGKKPISIPEGVTVIQKGEQVTVKGPKGELKQFVSSDLKVNVEGKAVILEREGDSKQQRAQHGLYRSLVANAVEGVANGYSLKLELVGVGYKAVTSGNVLELNLGYSHDIFFSLPAEVKATAEMVKGKNPKVTLESIDKQLVGQVAAKLRSLRKIEPYKGKGVRFEGEQVRRKAGKTAAK
jgi:large subunit ribosomal protein L6